MQRSASFLAFAACLMFGAMAAAPASAAETQSHATQVSYADLNLNNEAGAQVMLARIDNAARTTCHDRAGLMPLWEQRMVRTCVAERTTHAVDRLGNANVSALYYHRAPTVIVASR